VPARVRKRVLILSLGIVAACASNPPPDTAVPTSCFGDSYAIVTNDSPYDVDVWATVRSAPAPRVLGTVAVNARQEFLLPEATLTVYLRAVRTPGVQVQGRMGPSKTANLRYDCRK
jgi:hypothetical protein